jgi:glycosyltransferase involved in cell wall biosynthesis
MPLRFGTGSRSRLAQLLALGVPVVATPHAARGLGVRSGDGVVIAAAGPEFARVLGDVLLDASLRDDLSQRGRATAEAQFSIAATYEFLSEQLAAGPDAP